MDKFIISFCALSCALISTTGFAQGNEKPTVKKLNLADMSDTQIEEFAKKSFTIMDKNKDGYISKEEAPVAKITTTKNDKVSDVSINGSAWMNRNDADGNGLVDLKEFTDNLKKVAKKNK